MVHNCKGKYAVIEGLDGIGKGVLISSLKENFKKEEKIVLDLHEYWAERHVHPQFDILRKNDFVDLDSFDVLILAEPTYAGAGYLIREEVIAKNSRDYSAILTAQLYAIDRMTLDKRITLPALNSGKIVVKSRSVVSSLVYQPIQAEERGEKLTLNDVLSLEGNQFAIQNSPNILVIGTIKNPAELIKRLEEREKKDDAIFENINFQLKIKPHYESEWLRDLFEKDGTRVEYLDAGVSVESSKQQIVDIWEKFIGR